MLRVSQHPRHNSICFRPFAAVSHPGTRAARRCGPRLPSLPVPLLLPRLPALRGCIRPPFPEQPRGVGLLGQGARTSFFLRSIFPQRLESGGRLTLGPLAHGVRQDLLRPVSPPRHMLNDPPATRCLSAVLPTVAAAVRACARAPDAKWAAPSIASPVFACSGLLPAPRRPCSQAPAGAHVKQLGGSRILL